MPSPEQQQASPSAEGELGPGQRRVRREREFDSSFESDFRTREILAFKFGGSSLDGAERLRHSVSLVREAAQSSPLAVVVSAMKGVTDRLLRVAQLLADSRTQAARVEEHGQRVSFQRFGREHVPLGHRKLAWLLAHLPSW